MPRINTYRVWMKDGCANICHGETEAEAKAVAVEVAKKSLEGIAMTPAEKREAATVDYAEKLN